MPCESCRKQLDAYADGQLSPAEAAGVAEHLRQCGACAAAAVEVFQMKRSVAAAGRSYSPSAEFRSKVIKSLGKRRDHGRMWSWQMVFAPALIILILSAALIGYLSGGRSQRDRAYSELTDLHVATLASATPVDVVSEDRHTVKPWFEGKLPFTFNLPDLHGTDFTLVGGRVAYFSQAPGAQLIYRLRKHEISVFIFQDRGGPDLSSGPIPEFSFHAESWNSNGLRYFVVGDVGNEDVEALSKLLRNAG